MQMTGKETGLDIAILPLDLSDPDRPKAGTPETFVQTPFNDAEPAFSPDGHWIAYRSGDNGPADIIVRRYTTGNKKVGGRWEIANGGRAPQWSPDGRQLFYMSGGRIMSVPISVKEDSIVPGKPALWSEFELRNTLLISSYSVMPDGKRLLVLPAGPTPMDEKGKGNLHVIFLLNFFDYLRQRVPVERR
jgi:Tol biopolymer transport system component